MICDSLDQLARYMPMLPAAFKEALEWVVANRKNPPAVGRYELKNGAYAMVQLYAPKPKTGGEFENHHKYTDVQAVLKGHEWIYWTSPQNLSISVPYSDQKDVEFFKTDPAKDFTCIDFNSGTFAIFWPGDLHLPCIQPSRSTSPDLKFDDVLKVVVKVPVATKK